VSETAKKTRKKTTASRSTSKKTTASKSTRKKTKRAKATRKKKKKKSIKKARATKTARRKGSRGERRAPQGKRLGAWKIVKQAEVFRYLSTSGTTIAALARTLGVGASAVHAWKANRRFPSEQAQLKLRQILSGDLATVAAPKRKRGRSARFNGKAFRQAREGRGLSRARLSKDLGVSAGSIRNWEAGSSKPRGANLAKCRAFLAEAPAAASAAAPAAASAAAQPAGTKAARSSQAPGSGGGGGDSAVLGAVQVASAYISAGNAMGPDEVVGFVRSLRNALS
jgi:DNA-binding transcriptional regulator YiaG